MTDSLNLNGEVFKSDNTRVTIETIGTDLKPEDLSNAEEIVVTIETAPSSILLTKTFTGNQVFVVTNSRGQNSWIQFLIAGAVDLADIPAGVYQLRTVVTIGGNPSTLQNKDGSLGVLTVKP